MYTKPTATVTPRIPTLHLPVSLRPRDWAIVALLDEHPMLTTDQIAGILFNKLSTCRERLLLLLRMKFISRWWSDPFQPKPINLECWQPGVLSSRYVARQRRKRQPTENQVHDRNLEIYRNLSKNPIMQTNAFFTQLLTHSRTYAGTQLLRWWSADTVASQYKMISPNGGHGVWRLASGVWRDGHCQTGFFLHFDLRSRYRPTRSQQIEDFVGRRLSGNPRYPLLLVFRTAANEQAFHHYHRGGSVLADTIATATLADHPAEAVWKPVGQDRRSRISDLPSDHGSAGPANVGAPTPDDDPLRA